MGKLWKQVGGDVNPKDHGCILAKVDGDSVEIVSIEPNEEGPGWFVTTNTFYASDLEWGGQAHPEKMASSMGFDRKQWDETDLANRGAIATGYHGSGWGGDERQVAKWSAALPAKTNQIQWWR